MFRHPRLAAADGHDQDNGATTGCPVCFDLLNRLLLVGAEHSMRIRRRRDDVKLLVSLITTRVALTFRPEEILL